MLETHRGDALHGYTGSMRFSVALIFVLVIVSATASAQDRSSAFVGGSVSAANMASRTDLAYAGAFGYRFSRVVSFVIEATGIPKVRTSFPNDRPIVLSSGSVTTIAVTSVYPGPFFSDPGGRIVLFTNAARIDIPTTSARVTPFFAAGGGVAHVRRTANFTYPVPLPLTPGTPTIPVVFRPITERVTSTETDLTLALGGGVGVRLASSLFLDVDLRLFRLLADDDQNLGRFGVGVRYQF